MNGDGDSNLVPTARGVSAIDVGMYLFVYMYVVTYPDIRCRYLY